MKVKCKHGLFNILTRGRIYEVETECSNYYWIRDDKGDIANWTKGRFEMICDIDSLVNEVLKENSKSYVHICNELEPKMQKYIVKDGWDVEQSNETDNLDDAKAFARMQSKGDETLFIYEVKGDCLFVFVDGVEFGRNGL